MPGLQCLELNLKILKFDKSKLTIVVLLLFQDFYLQVFPVFVKVVIARPSHEGWEIPLSRRLL